MRCNYGRINLFTDNGDVFCDKKIVYVHDFNNV